MRRHKLLCIFFALTGVVCGQNSEIPSQAPNATGAGSSDLGASLGVSFPDDSHSTMVLERNGKRYMIDVATRSIREVTSSSSQQVALTTGPADLAAAATLFRSKCASCHGVGGHGVPAIGTPDFTNPSVQSGLTEPGVIATIHNGKGGTMPAWAGKISDPEIASLARYIRSLGTSSTTQQASAAAGPAQKKPSVYTPGDDVVFTLPTGRPIDRHGIYVNFTHRFAYDPAVSDRGRGQVLFGLDGFAIPSLGLTYGITDKLSASIYRSPTAIGRPIQLMTAYHFLDENRGAPFNLTARVSIEGQDNFRKSYTENLEAIVSRSITSRAQVYFVPTMSFNARALTQGGFYQILDTPGVNTFSLGVGLSVDVRPSIALVAEIIPTFYNARELGIHRPVYSFGIQKKLYRHAFTFGLTTGPGTTVSQRAGSRAQYLGQPGADTPGGLFLGFDLTRQIH
jgi:mono/diheme cytochrome c family protein